jgi:predicted O-methyltransferase YrrM
MITAIAPRLTDAHAAMASGDYRGAVQLLQALVGAGHATPEVVALLRQIASQLESAPSVAPDASDPLAPAFYGTSWLTPSTLARAAVAADTWDALLAFHGSLATDPYVRYVDAYYRACRSRFGSSWTYFDIINVLFASARLVRPARYLEIGVRRGRSLCTVVRGAPQVDVIAFDMWRANYAGMENPGPDFVRREAEQAGHRGRLEFVNGDSRRTVPAWFAANPGVTMDLITVDGDHSEEGARQDLRNVLPHLARGGVLVFDDIAHPQHPYLRRVWDEEVASQPGMQTFAWGEAGYGVAFGIRTA